MAICTVGHLRALISLMEAFDSHTIIDATNSALPLLLLLLRSDVIIIIAMIKNNTAYGIKICILNTD